MAANETTAPWIQCKVAFDIVYDERVWKQFFGDGRLKPLLPEGWELDETDCSGCRCVAVFSTHGIPSEEDGRTIRRLLSRAKAGKW